MSRTTAQLITDADAESKTCAAWSAIMLANGSNGTLNLDQVRKLLQSARKLNAAVQVLELRAMGMPMPKEGEQP